MAQRESYIDFKERAKILLGHACESTVGLRSGPARSWARQRSEQPEVGVIADAAYRAAVEALTRHHGEPAPRMIWRRLPKWSGPGSGPAGDAHEIQPHDVGHVADAPAPLRAARFLWGAAEG